jgi:hypothetical protein
MVSRIASGDGAAAFGPSALARLACCVLVLLWPGPAGAQHQSGAEDAIRALMKNTWERPGAALQVAPIIVEGDYAIAGWILEGHGGRALLIRRNGLWEVRLCGGSGLIKADAIRMAGASYEVAAKLAASIAQAEAAMPADDRSRLSLFQGIVEIDPGAAHGPGVAHGQGHK